MTDPVRDQFERPLRNLRLSVTDRCNLRCSYCMPEINYVWLPQPDVLTYEEMSRLVDVFITLGVDHVRITGGEPLLRRDVSVLVEHLAAKPALNDIALTTNGILLEERADDLVRAGIHRITISLDTLKADRFRALTRRDDLDRVLDGFAAIAGGPLARGLKIDTVLMRGINDDEIVPLLDFAAGYGAELRFIEYMDVGGATAWSADRVVSRREILERLAANLGPIHALDERTAAPADRFRLPDGRVFGIISSTTTPFCSTCNRARLTADGFWYLCLYAKTGLDIRGPLREGATDDELQALIRSAWTLRTDRGAEERLRLEQRGALLPRDELQADSRLEMHTRGG